MVVAGFAVGRWGKNARSDVLLLAGTLAAMVVLLLFEASRSLGWIYVAGIFGGVSEVLIAAASYSIVSSLIPPERRATLFGLFNATLFLSWGGSATLIAGPLVDSLVRAGRSELVAYRASYIVGLVITGAGLVMLLAQVRTAAFRKRLSSGT